MQQVLVCAIAFKQFHRFTLYVYMRPPRLGRMYYLWIFKWERFVPSMLTTFIH